MTDAQRELEIERHYQRMLNAPTPSIARLEFMAMVTHIKHRSAPQIDRMEREYGLLH